MNSTQYVPGDWKGVVAGDYLAFLPPDTEDRVIDKLWASMRAGEDLMSQLVIVTDGRFSGIGPFAIARVEGSRVHLLLRGEVEVRVIKDAGEETFFAPSVSTWLEQIVDDATHLQFSLSPLPNRSDGELANLTSYPILGGVFFASLLQIATGAHSLSILSAANVAGTEHAPIPPPPESNEKAVAPEQEKESAPDNAREERDAVWLDSDVPQEELVRVPGMLDEDHDGMTVMNSEVASLRRQLPAWEGGAVPGPLVDPADRTAVPKIVLSTGVAVALDRPLLLGRAPQVSRVKNDEMPRLITVESPNHDISRTHAEVRMSGSEIIVTDLDSTNGVLLTRPGAVAQRLVPNNPTPVEAGAIVDLGEGVTFVVGRQT